MRVARVIAIALMLFALAGTDAVAQQCPKGKLRFYTSWPMQGAMLPEGTGMKNGVDLAVSEVNGTVAGFCLEVVNLDGHFGRPESITSGANDVRQVGGLRMNELVYTTNVD